MRNFMYMDQDGPVYVTDEQIIKEYFPWWSKKMREVNREHLISEEHCIEDFCAVHWATEID